MVEFIDYDTCRDLSGRGENFADLTEEAIDKDIDDYADRMDARGKNGVTKSEYCRLL